MSWQIPVSFAIGSWEPVGAGWSFAEFPQSPPTPVCLSALPDVNPQIYHFVIKENQPAVFHSSPWKRVFQATLPERLFSDEESDVLFIPLPRAFVFFSDHKTVASSCAHVHSTVSPECLLCLSVGRGRWYGLRYRHSARGRQGRDPAAQVRLGDTMGDKTGNKMGTQPRRVPVLLRDLWKASLLVDWAPLPHFLTRFHPFDP